jgi:divalent metal cation (Fe/Co/Zn/Cd) transporter
MTTAMLADGRAALVRRGRALEYFTVGYNVAEGLTSLLAAWLAGSIALLGFGIDSVIEVSAGLILIWRLRADADVLRRERVEQRARNLVGTSLLLLSAYITYDAARSLFAREAPRESLIGIVVAALSVVIMPFLARAKRKVAAEIGSGALKAEAVQTYLCAYVSAILLAGLVLNATLQWWWADPAAALVMVPIIAREGLEALRGDECSCGH